MATEKKSDLFSLVSAVKENFDELREAADVKQSELEALRTTLWEILGSPPGSVNGTVELKGHGCDNYVMMDRVAEGLRLIRKDLGQNRPNNATGRVNAMLVMIGKEVAS